MIAQYTLQYLADLKENNHKPWFEANRNRFDEAKENFELFVGKVIEQFSAIDPDIAPLEVKNCVFRQYRDVRFSKDKTPYKHHMGASFDKGGKKSGFAGYYFHLEPGNNSMIGGGLWMPEADALKRVRQEIDYNWDEFKKIIETKPFNKIYGDLERGEYALSREPKGYDKDNPAIEHLKLKSFVAIKMMDDSALTNKNLLKTTVDAFTALMPMIKFINRALE